MNISFKSAYGNVHNSVHFKNRTLAFKGILADGLPDFGPEYCKYCIKQAKNKNTDFFKIKTSMSKIFRDLPSQVALAKMINPDEKTKIHVLGCSDGSEAFAYGIIFRTIMGKKSKKNVDILAIDLKKPLIDIADSRCIVCTDKEKNDFIGNSFIKHAKTIWKKYIKPTKCPKIFHEQVQLYPMLKYMEKNEVEQQYIGNGMYWYKIKDKDLPKITLENGDMFDYLKSDEQADNVIFVIANSGAYVSFDGGLDRYIDIFRLIKSQNHNKNIYVVIGDGELKYDETKNHFPSKKIEELGFKKLGNFDNNITINNDAKKKIYKLSR